MFSDVRAAFAHKTDEEIRSTYRIFRYMQYPLIVRAGCFLGPLCVRAHVPFVRSLVRKTIFKQFMGGETLASCTAAIDALNKYKIETILDYASEGRDTEAEFERVRDVFLQVLDYAKDKSSVPFISVKLTALGSVAFFSRFDLALAQQNTWACDMPKHIDETLRDTFNRVEARLDKIVQHAIQVGKPIMVDAEESWIQKTIDFLVQRATKKYNTSRAWIYHTLQIYRNDKLQDLHELIAQAAKENFIVGVKLVRGAYIEKESEYAVKQGVPCCIHTSKMATDTDYNAAMARCLGSPKVHVIIATHNEQSITHAVHAIQTQQADRTLHERVVFSQLYGMGDYLSYPLANMGYRVCKYLPFGSIDEAVPYLSRRAQENSSFRGQSTREYELLQKEMRRRKLL